MLKLFIAMIFIGLFLTFQIASIRIGSIMDRMVPGVNTLVDIHMHKITISEISIEMLLPFQIGLIGISKTIIDGMIAWLNSTSTQSDNFYFTFPVISSCSSQH